MTQLPPTAPRPRGVLSRLAALSRGPLAVGVLLRAALAFTLVATALPAVLEARTLELGARVELTHADTPAGTLDAGRDALGVLGLSPSGGAGRAPQPATHAVGCRDPFASVRLASRRCVASAAPSPSRTLAAQLVRTRRARLRHHAPTALDDDPT